MSPVPPLPRMGTERQRELLNSWKCGTMVAPSNGRKLKSDR